ncbi:hypothetical protein L1987_85969 [Smallanthus sonchifolius]|uniref:Uncharacterized protein n=1 Tax=Smallanthus sonchifolius TaxID=185202 RepID=A0ACB8XYP4_9ASTR|nr:hypothetical protein L1987_85969 [Smallanthus sonchifolius]
MWMQQRAGIGADGVWEAIVHAYEEDKNYLGKAAQLMGVGLKFTVHTGAGLIIPEIQHDGKVKVDMGEPEGLRYSH